MGQYDFVLDQKTWSFSSIDAYNTCPYMFYLQYIKEVKGVENAFAQFGTFCHELLEKYEKGDLEIFQLSEEYSKDFEEKVSEPFPPNKYKNLSLSYYEAGKDYFNSFDGWNDYEILAVEKEVYFKIDKYNLKGYIDLIVRDKEGKIQIIDHKSKSKFKNKQELSHYLIQLYLYSIAVLEEYGEYPSKLNFNMFKEQNFISVDFDIEDLGKAKQWVVDTIKSIYSDEEFATKSNRYFCDYICSMRHNCKCSNSYIDE